jgi:hypothetical protein
MRGACSDIYIHSQNTQKYMDIQLCVCECRVCMYVYTRTCIYIHTHTHTYTCISAHIHMNINTYILYYRIACFPAVCGEGCYSSSRILLYFIYINTHTHTYTHVILTQNMMQLTFWIIELRVSVLCVARDAIAAAAYCCTINDLSLQRSTSTLDAFAVTASAMFSSHSRITSVCVGMGVCMYGRVGMGVCMYG